MSLTECRCNPALRELRHQLARIHCYVSRAGGSTATTPKEWRMSPTARANLLDAGRLLEQVLGGHAQADTYLVTKGACAEGACVEGRFDMGLVDELVGAAERAIAAPEEPADETEAAPGETEGPAGGTIEPPGGTEPEPEPEEDAEDFGDLDGF
jgi:hypothetical protein